MAKGQSYESSLRQRLLGDTAFLLSITDKPEDASRNESSPGSDGGKRQLAPEHERQLADDFAFLAATTDSANRVVAVGLEERPNGKGLTIRLTANTGLCGDAFHGLRAIAETLEEAAKRGKVDTVLTFFATIIVILRLDLGGNWRNCLY